MRARSGGVRTAVAVVVVVVSLAGCQTGRGDPTGSGAGPDLPGADACAGGAPDIETLTPYEFEGEPPPEEMDWEQVAGTFAGEVTAIAGDRLAAVWIARDPDRSVQVRLTEGPEIPGLQAAADASGLVVGIAYDRAFSEADLTAASAELSGEWAQVPGISGMSVDTLSSRLLFYVAAGDDGGAATCAAIAAILADVGVPYAFEVFDGPTESTVRGPVGFGEAALVGDRRLRMNVWSCNGDPEVTALEQTDTEVRLEVTSTVAAPGWPDDGCLDGIEVTLDAPLGARALIDLTTGDTVPVAAAQG